jgi:hypothetical protein
MYTRLGEENRRSRPGQRQRNLYFPQGKVCNDRPHSQVLVRRYLHGFSVVCMNSSYGFRARSWRISLWLGRQPCQNASILSQRFLSSVLVALQLFNSLRIVAVSVLMSDVRIAFWPSVVEPCNRRKESFVIWHPDVPKWLILQLILETWPEHGVATNLPAGWLGSAPWQGHDICLFCVASRPALEPTRPPVQYRGSIPGVKAAVEWSSPFVSI